MQISFNLSFLNLSLNIILQSEAVDKNVQTLRKPVLYHYLNFYSFTDTRPVSRLLKWLMFEVCLASYGGRVCVRFMRRVRKKGQMVVGEKNRLARSLRDFRQNSCKEKHTRDTHFRLFVILGLEGKRRRWARASLDETRTRKLSGSRSGGKEQEWRGERLV